MRSETFRLTTAVGVRWGHEGGRLERLAMDWPALYLLPQRLTVGHEHKNRAATSLTGQSSSNTRQATLTRACGVRAALARDMRRALYVSGR